VAKLQFVANFFRMSGLFVGLLIFLASVFIISNTIKLSLYTRIEEIVIMKLVGGTNSFIKTPYLIEGVIQGLMGSLIAVMFLFGGYRLFLSQIRIDEIMVLGFGNLSFISILQAIQLAIVGICIGFMGSYISVDQFLKPKYTRR